MSGAGGGRDRSFREWWWLGRDWRMLLDFDPVLAGIAALSF